MNDEKAFEFYLGRNGRLDYPMKFEIKDFKKGGIELSEKSNQCLIRLGDIELWKEDYKYYSDIYYDYDAFDYHDEWKPLHEVRYDKDYFSYNDFKPKSILVIQMRDDDYSDESEDFESNIEKYWYMDYYL